MGLGIAGPEPDRSVEFVDRLVESTRVFQGGAEVVMGLSQVGPEGDRAAAGSDRFVDPAQLPEGVAQVAVGLGMIGANCDRAVEAGNRLFRLSGPAVRLTQIGVIGDAVRVDGDRPADQVDGRCASDLAARTPSRCRASA